MKLGWTIGLGLIVAAGIGAVVFLGSRKAVAAETAKTAFKIAPDCKRIEVIDEAEAKSAIIAAALGEFHGKNEPAVALLDRVGTTLFPQCGVLADDTLIDAPGYPTVPLSLIKGGLTGKSVGDLMAAMTDMEKEKSSAPPREGSTGSPSPRDTFLTNAIFGGLPS
jgi:hypothetical protein